MKNIKAFIIVLSLFSLAACSYEDYFTPIVEVDIPAEKPRLVLISNALVGDSGITVFVTKTRGILDNSPYFTTRDSTPYKRWNDTTTYWQYSSTLLDSVNNAKVEFFKNDILIATLKENKKGLYSSTLNTPLSSGATYRIRVSAAGYETIEAVQKAPSIVKIDTIILRQNIKVNDPNDPLNFPEVDEYGIQFKDPINENNAYYANAKVSVKSTSRSYDYDLYLNSFDVLSQINYFNDTGFDGKNLTWRHHSWSRLNNYSSNNSDKINVKFTFYTVTKERFLFAQSIEKYNSAKDNPFAEPVTIYNNVKNGLGLFTMAATSEYNLKVQ